MYDWFDSSFGFDVKSALESDKSKQKRTSKRSKPRRKKATAQNDLELGIQGFQNTINGINSVAKNFKRSISGPTAHQKNLALAKKAKQYEDEEKAYLAAQKAQGKIGEIKRKRAYRQAMGKRTRETRKQILGYDPQSKKSVLAYHLKKLRGYLVLLLFETDLPC